MASFMVPAAGGTAAVLAGILVSGSGSGFSSELALTIVGAIGNALAFVLNFIPLITFVWPVVKEKGVGDRTAYGHVVMMASGAAWGLYAAPTWPKTGFPAVINGMCFVLQLLCVMVFIVYAEGNTRWIAASCLMLALIVSLVLAWCVFVKVMARGEWKIDFIAPIASGISCLSYAAVGLDIAAVVRSKDVSNMDPLVEVVLNMLNAAAWVYYAYLSIPVDNYTGVPNVVGVICLIVELVVFVKHCRAEPQTEETGPPETEADPPAPEETSRSSSDLGLRALFAVPSPQADVPAPEAEIEVVLA